MARNRADYSDFYYTSPGPIYKLIGRLADQMGMPATLHFDTSSDTCNNVYKLITFLKLGQTSPAEIIQRVLELVKSSKSSENIREDESPVRSILVNELLNYFKSEPISIAHNQDLLLGDDIDSLLDPVLSKISFDWRPGLHVYPIDYDPTLPTFDRYNLVESTNPPTTCKKWTNLMIPPVCISDRHVDYLTPEHYFDSMGQVLTACAFLNTQVFLKLEYNDGKIYVLFTKHGIYVASFDLFKLESLLPNTQTDTGRWIAETAILLMSDTPIRNIGLPTYLTLVSECGNMRFRRVMRGGG